MKYSPITKPAFLAASLMALAAWGQSVPPLINYQGRLTDQTGAPLSPGTYGIKFRIWDDALALGTNDLIWGQQQTVTIQSNGVFNAILGSPGGSPIQGATPAVNDITFAFTSSNRFFGLTVASQNGVAIPAPVEILPRQQILSVPFSLTAASVIPGAIGSQQIANGAVGAQQIAQGGIQTPNLGGGVVTLTNLAPRQVGTNVPVGGVARSPSITVGFANPGSSGTTVPGLTATLVTSGLRPVLVLLNGGCTNCTSTIQSNAHGGYLIAAEVFFLRNGFLVSDQSYNVADLYTIQQPNGEIPPSAFHFMDFPPAGTNAYSVKVGNLGTANDIQIYNVQLVALEL